MSAPTLGGHPVFVSPFLPIHPSDGERARRMVRHGLVDVLDWLGWEVGPLPDSPTRVMVATDGTLDGPLTFAVDQQTYDQLKASWAA